VKADVGLILVDPGHEELQSGLPLPAQWGWRVINAVIPDELHDDAPVTLAAVRELRATARPFPDVPAAAPQVRHVVVDGAGHNIPRDRPDAVADTILAVAAQARASGG
jgi:hypothetical protein